MESGKGTCHREALTPLTRSDGSTATSSRDKATLLSELFANKMKVDNPPRPALQLAQETERTVTAVMMTAEQVKQLLGPLDVGKATGPNDVKHYANELVLWMWVKQQDRMT